MISVVIPNWNGKALLEKHLPDVIRAKENAKNEIVEVIVVDDGSTDESVSYLEGEYGKKIRLIKQEENRGFASSANLGVRMARGDLVCLLNTDVSPSEDFLENVLKHFNDGSVFAVSLHEKGYGPAKGIFRNGYFEHSELLPTKEATKTMWVSGGSGVFRRSIWKELKGFDEELFAPFYWEDVDLSYRAQKRGYKVVWEPEARVLHQHEATISTDNFRKRQMDLIKERNQLLFMWKNITSKSMMKKHMLGLVRRMAKGPGYIVVVLMALKKWGLVRKRRAVELRKQKVSDEVILARFN